MCIYTLLNWDKLLSIFFASGRIDISVLRHVSSDHLRKERATVMKETWQGVL